MLLLSFLWSLHEWLKDDERGEGQGGMEGGRGRNGEREREREREGGGGNERMSDRGMERESVCVCEGRREKCSYRYRPFC